MRASLEFNILPQPDDTTCGPTCLHALYSYYGDDMPLDTLIAETHRLENGGALGVHLACHALRRGYEALIYTFNLQVFDPTWFADGGAPTREKLDAQAAAKSGRRLRAATSAYKEFISLGGRLRLEDLTSALVRKYMKRSTPVLTGLSATYLYRESRQDDDTNVPDDIGGVACGHFVVLCGYDREKRTVTVADPLHPNPVSPSPLYEVNIDRLVCSILMGVLTYDANLLIIQPKG